MKKWIAVGAIGLTALAGGLAGCGGDDDENAGGDTAAATAPAAPADTTAGTTAAPAEDQEAIRATAAEQFAAATAATNDELNTTGTALNEALASEQSARIGPAISAYADAIQTFDELARVIVVPVDTQEVYTRMINADMDAISAAADVVRALDADDTPAVLEALAAFNEADAAAQAAAGEVNVLLGIAPAG